MIFTVQEIDMQVSETISHSKTDLLKFFSEGRHFQMEVILSYQAVDLLPEYEYCPECSFCLVIRNGWRKNVCTRCNNSGQIKYNHENSVINEICKRQLSCNKNIDANKNMK
jgi:hypothetical protein